MPNELQLLVINPHDTLEEPYPRLPSNLSTTHVTSTQQATQYLSKQQPDYIIIHSSYDPKKIVDLLDTIKQSSEKIKQLIPIIFHIDHTNRINLIPGTAWAGKIGFIQDFSSDAELTALFARL